jgi:hypothetical protein
VAAFEPADGQLARWRRVDEYVDKKKDPGDLVTFQEIQHLLDVDKQTAVGVIQQVREKREKAGKPTLVTMRGMGWMLARPEDELEEDKRRHEHAISAVEGRVRLLGSLQSRRSRLSQQERQELDFRLGQAAIQADVLGSRKVSASEILGGGTKGSSVPITARAKDR